MNPSFDEKLLVIHADDLGMCHSTNEAILELLEKEAVSSASIMPPCQWFWEAAEKVNQKPNLDIGVHLTFTSELSSCRWRPLSCPERNSGLIDQHGMLHRAPHDLLAPSEVIIKEVLAQVDLCIRCGVVPTHLDSHMFVLFHESRVSSYIETAKMLNTPCLLPRLWNGKPRRSLGATNYHLRSRNVDNLIYVGDDVPPSSWEQFYINQMNSLGKGINQLIVHPGFDTPELRAMVGGEDPWGAEWRQRDHDVLLSPRFNEALARNRIKVVSWKDIKTIAGSGSIASGD